MDTLSTMAIFSFQGVERFDCIKITEIDLSLSLSLHAEAALRIKMACSRISCAKHKTMPSIQLCAKFNFIFA